MDISTRLDFAATPADVFTMMLDKGYLEEVCVASESTGYEVSVTGTTSRVSRTLPAPESAAKFVGAKLTVVEEVVWSDEAADGSHSATMTMTVPGQPVALKGRLLLAAGGKGTTVSLDADLKVSIPLLGKKLEQAAAPAVMAGFRTQQKVGDRFLAR